MQKLSWLALSDELDKIAEADRLNRGHLSQVLKNVAMITAGTALGTGAGVLAAKGVQKLLKRPDHPAYLALPILTGLGGAYMAHHKAKRDEEADQLVEEAGKRHAQEQALKTQPRAKIARVLASPEEWTLGQRGAITGAGVGALTGFGAGGLANLVSGSSKLKAMTLAGTGLGSLYGLIRAKKLEKQLRGGG